MDISSTKAREALEAADSAVKSIKQVIDWQSSRIILV